MSTITSTSPVADCVAEIEAEIEKRSADIDERIKDAVFERRDLTAGEKYASERDKAQIDKLEAELDEIRGQAAELRSRQLFTEIDRMRRGGRAGRPGAAADALREGATDAGLRSGHGCAGGIPRGRRRALIVPQ
jgi:hypothetical protein